MSRSEERLYLTGRIALFVVFFWFGSLKLFGLSPANPLVEDLLAHTMPFWPFSSFVLVLGAAEMVIGTLFLFPKATKVALWILCLHLFTTFTPLILLPKAVWQAPMVPTLEGQYIIKNVVILALALLIGTHTHFTARSRS